MTVEPKCRAAANLKGEHVACDLPAGHAANLVHCNSEFGLIWASADEMSVPSVREHPNAKAHRDE